MAARKTPILLRQSSLTGEVMALHRYTRKVVRGRDVIDTGMDGKQSVTADFDAIVLEFLLDPDAKNICEALDGAALGMELSDAERAEIRAFRTRLVELIERHNTMGHGQRPSETPSRGRE